MMAVKESVSPLNNLHEQTCLAGSLPIFDDVSEGDLCTLPPILSDCVSPAGSAPIFDDIGEGSDLSTLSPILYDFLSPVGSTPIFDDVSEEGELTEVEEDIDIITVEHNTDRGHHNAELPPRRHTEPPQTIIPTPTTQFTKSGNLLHICSPANSPRKATQRKKRLIKCHDQIGFQDSTEMAKTRRICHNSEEKKRRNKLKIGFDNLRMEIPSIKRNPRASQRIILEEAVKYIKVLRSREQDQRLI